MALVIDLLRPDDLLTLRIEATNLRLDTSDPALPCLVREDQEQPVVVAVVFPPQSIAEEAYYDARNAFGQPTATTETPKPPGEVPARIAGPSRLVFTVPLHVLRIPYTTEALLGWSGWIARLAPVAALPDDPTPEQMAQAPDVAAPGPLETAIELPYRLVLSPGADAAWLHSAAPVTRGGRTELWHTRLGRRPAPGQAGGPAPLELAAASPAALRAVWSPDFREAAQGPPDHDVDARPFRTSLTPRDRHQIVVRCSAFLGFFEGDGRAAVPKPLKADRLFLSGLGGWLRSRGAWGAPSAGPTATHPRWSERLGRIADLVMSGEAEQERPAAEVADLATRVPSSLLWRTNVDRSAGLIRADDLDPAVAIPAEGLDPAVEKMQPHLDLSEWVHHAAQGRDHYVRVVYEGRLYPFCHRASLVKVTERRIESSPGGASSGAPVAYLRQREYIVVREPLKSYYARIDDPASRAMPLGSRLRLTTLVTPNIEDKSKEPWRITGGSFWVGVAGEDFRFHLVARDAAGRDVDFTAALIFVPDGEQQLSEIEQAYHNSGPRRACLAGGRKVALAPPSPEQPEDTAFATTALYFDGDISGGSCVPRLERADVRVPAVEQLLGTTAATSVRLYKPYVHAGFDVHAGVFAEVVVPGAGGALEPASLAVGFSAERAGGIATPNLQVSGLSRGLGPVAGSLAVVAAGTFDPGDFFPPALADAAKLFGSVPLGELVGGGPVTQKAPRLRIESVPPGPAPDEIVTSFEWEPDVKTGTFRSILVTGPQTRLTLSGRITRPVRPGAGDARFDLIGRLTDFEIQLAGVIELRFDEFRFGAASGQKPDVEVRLADERPVTFKGALSFVDTLSQVIPKGVFGANGPSIDLTPTALAVGYSIGLPPLSVGVFALENVTIATALRLPFLSGKPQLDFSFAERHHPFVLAVTLLGGGGFLHLALDAERVVMVEGALEFGGHFALDLGVATGAVTAMAGIYFRLASEGSEITGYYRISGEVTALGIISVSVVFELSLSYFPGPPELVRGRAVLIVCVEVFCFEKSIELSVERSFSPGGADPAFGEVTTAAEWQDYAAAFA